MSRTEKNNINSDDLDFRQSIFYDTNILKYIDCVSKDAIADRDAAFRLESKSFVSEVFETLKLYPHGSEKLFMRYELLRLYVVKTLLYIGLDPSENGFMPAAKFICNAAMHPSLDIAELTKESGMEQGDTEKSESTFTYDEYVYEHIYLLTGANPMTPKEAITDIAMYIRNKFLVDNQGKK